MAVEEPEKGYPGDPGVVGQGSSRLIGDNHDGDALLDGIRDKSGDQDAQAEWEHLYSHGWLRRELYGGLAARYDSACGGLLEY